MGSNLTDIESSRQHVCRDKDFGGAIPEFTHYTISVFMQQVSMYRSHLREFTACEDRGHTPALPLTNKRVAGASGHLVAISCQLRMQTLAAIARLDKYDGLPEVLAVGKHHFLQEGSLGLLIWTLLWYSVPRVRKKHQTATHERRIMQLPQAVPTADGKP